MLDFEKSYRFLASPSTGGTVLGKRNPGVRGGSDFSQMCDFEPLFSGGPQFPPMLNMDSMLSHLKEPA